MGSPDYEEFYVRTYSKVLSAVIMATGDRGDSEDAVQESYFKAFSRWETISEYDVPEAWVTKVAIRQFWKSARPRRRAAQTSLEVTVPPMSTPEQAAEASEVLGALASLPKDIRISIVLCCALGWPQQDVADTFGVPRATIANRIMRGRVALLQMLGLAKPAPGAREPLLPGPRPVPQYLAVQDADPLTAALTRTYRWLCASIEAEPGLVRQSLAEVLSWGQE